MIITNLNNLSIKWKMDADLPDLPEEANPFFKNHGTHLQCGAVPFYTPFRKVALVILNTLCSRDKTTMQQEEEAPGSQFTRHMRKCQHGGKKRTFHKFTSERW